MRNILARLGAVSLLALCATPALAQDNPQTQTKPDVEAAPEAASPISITGGAALVSDYRFRGISQTDRDFAVQGNFTVAHESGFYVGLWGSSIDDYVAFGSDQEIDLIAGFKKTTTGGTTFDVGVLYYVYPGFNQGVDTDFFEPYAAISHTLGPVTGKVTVNYAPSQSALDYGFGDEDGVYLAGDLTGSYQGIGLSAHIGHSFTRNYLTGGQKYTDWSLGANYTYRALTFGIQYVDTDADALLGPSGKDIYGSGLVGTVSVAF